MKEYLEELFLFENCDFEKTDREFEIISRASVLPFRENEIILSYNEGERGIYVVIEGFVTVASDKKCNTVLRRLEPGDTFGAASVFSLDNLYKTSVVSQTDSRLLLLKRDLCEELVCKNSQCAKNLIKFLSGRVAFLNRKISAFSAGNAEEKIAIWILSLPLDGDGMKTVANYSEAASSLCLGRASLYRALDSLEEKGIIRREGKKITILNEEKLTSLF